MQKCQEEEQDEKEEVTLKHLRKIKEEDFKMLFALFCKVCRSIRAFAFLPVNVNAFMHKCIMGRQHDLKLIPLLHSLRCITA